MSPVLFFFLLLFQCEETLFPGKLHFFAFHPALLLILLLQQLQCLL